MKQFKPEKWCMIGGYRFYQISNHGRVKSLSRLVRDKNGIRIRRVPECILKQKTDKLGYKKVSLRADYGTIIYLVHRLVGEAFVDNPRKLVEINHKFGNTSDNYFENLEWCTHQENMAHAGRTGLMKNRANKKEIYLFSSDAKYLQTHDSIRHANKETPYTRTFIQESLRTGKKHYITKQYFKYEK